MYFSVGILYSAQELLRFIKENPRLVSDFPKIFTTFDNIASAKAVFELCQKCEWIRLDIDGYLEVTGKSDDILSSTSVERMLRVQIQHLVEAYKPTWIPLLTRGRSEALKYLPDDVVQCLREAELTTSYSDDVILWWDKIGKISRKTGKDEKVDVGRRGEKMSIDYERARTQKEPAWRGFETNFSGYDVLSVIDSKNPDFLNIEVKTSNSTWEVASFYVSKNEWSVAKSSPNYLFHLWTLIPKSKLYVVSVDKVETHIPINRGEGTWESAEISFSSVCQKDQNVIVV
jgi:hypothetical protein